MQGLRAKNQVDKRSSLAYVSAFLTRYTAANTNDQLGVRSLQGLPPTQLVKYFFLSFFANRTGIQQQHICLFLPVRQFQPVAFTE